MVRPASTETKKVPSGALVVADDGRKITGGHDVPLLPPPTAVGGSQRTRSFVDAPTQVRGAGTGRLMAPHGGELKDLMLTGPALVEETSEAHRLPSITLTPRQECDLELLLTGAFSPLEGFLGEADYRGVVDEMRLASGTLWPMPIVLDLSDDERASIEGAEKIALRDRTGLVLATLEISDIYRPDRHAEAERVFGTTDTKHPGVRALLEETGPNYVGGRLRGVRMPQHHDHTHLRHGPKAVRAALEAAGIERVVAFQTRNPMHRAHYELTRQASERADAHLLVQPVVGMTKPGDVDARTRVKTYQRLMPHYEEGQASLSLLPLAMRMGGPREALWHAIIRKNYGASHFIVGRDHAGPGKGSDGRDFYGPYDAQELIRAHADELGIEMVPFEFMVYAPSLDRYIPIDEAKEKGIDFETLSGTQMRAMLGSQERIPDWFSFPEVVEILEKAYPPKHEQGLTIFFTGLSGSGKSTIANALVERLLAEDDRAVTFLDGDVVRTNLGKGLGFSKDDRSTNVRRVGYVASEVARHRGIAVCAMIAPHEADRRANRELISDLGNYVEVFVDTPLEVCIERDVKGLYEKAIAGEIQNFTGISDPYDVPVDAEIVIQDGEVETAVDRIVSELRRRGLIEPPKSDEPADGALSLFALRATQR